MSTKYPHLTDTNFPNLENANPYHFKNTFDYTKWDVDSHIKLCNINWNPSYDNVVVFNNDEARDSYFNNLSGESVDLNSQQILQPQGNIKLPFPFDVAQRYNYLAITYPNQSIPEEKDFGRKVYYYFINDIQQIAPSTTEFFISLDIWTTFINSIDINYMMLEQGHAPMIKSKVDDYLQNPINNSKYLLSEDYDVEDSQQVAHNEMIVFNDEDIENQLVCFATTSKFDGNFGTKHTDSWQIPNTSNVITQGLPTNINMYAVDGNMYSVFMNDICDRFPQIYRTIKAIFVIPKKLLTITSSFNFGNVKVYNLDGSQKKLFSFKLTKEMFNYDENYKNITKLYTFPYSYVELSNDEDSKLIIKIESTNNDLSAYGLMNSAFPFINFNLLLTGIGNTSEKFVKFSNLKDNNFIYGGDWNNYLIKYNIPSYAVITQPYTEFDVNQYWPIEDIKTSAKVTYDNDNASNATNYNVADRNRDSDFHAVSDRADVITNNANTEANKLIGNTSIDNAKVVNITNRNNAQIKHQAHWTGQQGWAETNANNELTLNTTQAETEKTYNIAIANGIMSTPAQIGSGIASGSMIGAGIGAAVGAGVGAIPGAIVGGIAGAGSSVAGQIVNSTSTVNALQSVANMTVERNDFMAESSSNYNNYVSTGQVDCNNETANMEVESRNQVANNSATAMRSEANFQSGIEKGVANTTSSNTASNNTETLNTNNANVQRSYNLVSQKVNYQQNEGKLEAPSQYGEYTNGKSQSTIPMFAQFNVITKSKSSIAQIGDNFLRYGYMLGQNWNFEKFDIMKYFTYWKVSEIWLTSTNKYMTQNMREKIKDILYNGTSVWSNPEKIGGVSIYENFNTE